MHAVIDIAIVATEIGTHPVSIFDRMKTLGRIVAQYSERLKIDDVAVAQLVEVFGREIAVDSAADAIAFRAHPNDLRYLDPAVLHHGDIAVEFENTLVGAGQYRDRHQQEARELPHSTDPNLTSGTFAASSAVFWKNSRGLKPNSPATTLLGTVSVIVL